MSNMRRCNKSRRDVRTTTKQTNSEIASKRSARKTTQQRRNTSQRGLRHSELESPPLARCCGELRTASHTAASDLGIFASCLPLLCVRLCCPVFNSSVSAGSPDVDALEVLSVSLVQQARWAAVVTLLTPHSALVSKRPNLSFHLAYALYRDKHHARCLDELKKRSSALSEGELHLQAQALYRAGQYAAAARVYRDTQLAEDDDVEMQANMLAALVSAGQLDDAKAYMKKVRAATQHTVHAHAALASLSLFCARCSLHPLLHSFSSLHDRQHEEHSPCSESSQFVLDSILLLSLLSLAFLCSSVAS